jgi:parvulin-like peptidyl-prolyl isomerase
MMRQLPNCLSRATLLSLALVTAGDIVAANNPTPPAPASAAAPSASAAAPSAVFAKVGDTVITQEEYNVAFSVAGRGKFYHGKPPDGEIAVLQREVSDQLVAKILLEREAKKRGLRPDDAEVQKTVKSYEQRYAGSEQWKKNKARLLPPLVARLGQDSIVSQLEKTVRTGVKPSDKDVRAYFAAHQDQFTEPEQLRVSVILLKVDPSATTAVWKKAEEQAQAIAKRVRGGEDFAAIARKESADESAPQGGDMGYLHTGMLPDGTQEMLAKMKVGQTADALRLLQGQAVFRLTGRKQAKLHTYEEVKVRAEQLAQREMSERAWTKFLAELKTKTPVKVDQSHFLPLAAAKPSARATATAK